LNRKLQNALPSHKQLLRAIKFRWTRDVYEYLYYYLARCSGDRRFRLVAFAKVHRKKIVIGVFEIIVRKIGVILIRYGSRDGQELTWSASETRFEMWMGYTRSPWHSIQLACLGEALNPCRPHEVRYFILKFKLWVWSFPRNLSSVSA